MTQFQETHTVTTNVFKFEDLAQDVQDQALLDLSNGDWHIQDVSDQATEAANAALAEVHPGVICTQWDDRHGQIWDFRFEDSLDNYEVFDEDHSKYDDFIQIAGQAIHDTIYSVEYVIEDFYSEDARFNATGDYVCEANDVD